MERIGVFRFSLGMVFMMLGIYLARHVGAPVNLISGFPPPTFYSEWIKEATVVVKVATAVTSKRV